VVLLAAGAVQAAGIGLIGDRPRARPS
jgi:hypothetical protein